MELKIRKRQGGIDAWSDDKILTSMMRAGASTEEAQQVADAVREWTQSNSDNGVIKSVQLRDQVIKNLKQINPIAANTYQIYKG